MFSITLFIGIIDFNEGGDFIPAIESGWTNFQTGDDGSGGGGDITITSIDPITALSATINFQSSIGFDTVRAIVEKQDGTGRLEPFMSSGVDSGHAGFCVAGNLAPNTNYRAKVQGSSDGGMTWPSEP